MSSDRLSPLMIVDVGVGVHRTRLRSFSFPFDFATRVMISARLADAVPEVVRSNSRLAAGVRFPAASTLRGVQVGGPMSPLCLALAGVRAVAGVRPIEPIPNNPAFARRLLEALLASF
jgi:hypothetical protein